MAGNKNASGGLGLPRELWGLLLFFLAGFTALALVSYDPLDPGLNRLAAPGHKPANLAGMVGAYWAGLLVDMVGAAAFFLPLWLIWASLRRFFASLAMPAWRWVGLGLLVLFWLTLNGSPWIRMRLSLWQVRGGGLCGATLYAFLERYFSDVGAFFLLFFLLVSAIQITLGISLTATWNALVDFAERLFDWGYEHYQRRQEESVRRKKEADQAARQAPVAPMPPVVDNFLDAVDPKPSHAPAPPVPEPGEPPAAASSAKTAKKTSRKFKLFAPAAPEQELPALDLLTAPPPEAKAAADLDAAKKQAQSLATCLADFGIQGEVQRIVPGPVVTMFEYKPAPGVKISRIAGLSDDLALAMKALAVRIEAPIPGKDSVGVEIPSAKRQTVYLREILESPAFRDSNSKLTLAVGKDISGKPHVADLARMPHLLVAGATGAGKSVCINGVLLSILYKATPEEVKLLLVDPKRIELSVYADLPHLVHPVVTEMAMAKNALDWAVHEMDRRYEAMARLGVRNIFGYNEKLSKLGDDRPEELADLDMMPFLVIIIDELADLMMTQAKEVEISIVRLAQLARASGIHMILATQRPSVDVVTGLIKANFPTRISFQVTSKHDSRTILDTVGAEHLLGRGDMLFKPSGGKMTRMHGAFVSDEETAAVVQFWKDRAAPSFDLDFSEWQKDGPAASDPGPAGYDNGGGGGDVTTDPVYPNAVAFVMEQGKASISLIQRRFRIGFNRAARFIEQMERDGILGPQEGSKPRSVMRGKE